MLWRTLPVLLAVTVSGVEAQTAEKRADPAVRAAVSTSEQQTFRLKDARPETLRELYIVLHNLLDSRATVSLEEGRDGVEVRGAPDQLQLAQKIVDDLDAAERDGDGQPASAAFAMPSRVTVHVSGVQLAEQTLYLPSGMSASEEAVLCATLRQAVSPASKMYLLDTRHMIVMNTTPGQLQVAQTSIKQAIPGWSPVEGKTVSSMYQGQSAVTYTDAAVEQAFYLPADLGRNDANEVLVALRNTLSPTSKVYLVPSENVLVITGTANELELAQKVLRDLTAGVLSA